MERVRVHKMENQRIPTFERNAFSSESVVETKLLQIWRELLRIDEIRPQDDFFEIGGDSLAAIRMLDHIEREFGEGVLEPDIIYSARTFSDLEVALTQALAGLARTA